MHHICTVNFIDPNCHPPNESPALLFKILLHPLPYPEHLDLYVSFQPIFCKCVYMHMRADMTVLFQCGCLFMFMRVIACFAPYLFFL